jgi:superfamily I DNA/RNA helicase
MFSAENGKKKNVVTLCTVHKCKGLEAPRAIILNSFLMPSRFAKQDWQIEQERNLIYVAQTRAKEILAYVDLPMGDK